MITNVQLTTKERYLLEDARSHEEQCIRKYQNCVNLASDDELKAVFRTNGQKEEEHLQTINQLLSGTVPAMGGQSQSGRQSSGQSSGQNSTQWGQPGQSDQSGKSGKSTAKQVASGAVPHGAVQYKASDKDLCTDMLMTEKYVSATYNTAIFEFKDASVRDVLNHIQKEEQKHGEAIFAYMQSKGMYTPE